MSINLPTNLNEKMEYMISQYIEELHNLGILEEAKEYYNSRENIIKYDLYIINVLFDASTLPNYNKMRIFNQISNDYFIKEDKNELKKYHDDYVSKMNNRRRQNWIRQSRNFTIYELIFTVAYIFARTNKQIIMEKIECVDKNVILK
jgi:hypothetical protein